MQSRRTTLPAGRRRRARPGSHALAGPLAVGLVGGTVAVAIVTGVNPAAAREVAAAPRVVAPVRPLVAAAPDPAVMHEMAMSVVTAARREHATTASRSRHRAPLHRWVRPYGGVLTSGFGMRWGRLHAGIDLAGPYGSPIVAATDGCITYAGPESGYGEVMEIRDWDGTETVYGHMSSFVRTSGCVRAGQMIARIGSAGDATGPHLHFEVRVHGVPIDPIPFLARHGVRI